MTTLRLRAAAAALVLLVPGMPACRAEPAAGTNLDIASTFPGSMPILGDAARGLAERVTRASGGELMLKFHEPGKLVPGAETVNAVVERQGAGGLGRRRLVRGQGQRLQHVLQRAVRAGHRRVHGVDVSRRRPRDGARDVPPARRAQHPVRHHSAGGLGLVPEGNQDASTT